MVKWEGELQKLQKKKKRIRKQTWVAVWDGERACAGHGALNTCSVYNLFRADAQRGFLSQKSPCFCGGITIAFWPQTITSEKDGSPKGWQRHRHESPAYSRGSLLSSDWPTNCILSQRECEGEQASSAEAEVGST